LIEDFSQTRAPKRKALYSGRGFPVSWVHFSEEIDKDIKDDKAERCEAY